MRFVFLLTAFRIVCWFPSWGVPTESSQPGTASSVEIDLSSDTAWTLRCDNGPSRPIKVPGGGWTSDEQSPPIQVMRDVRDYVLYQLKIVIPQVYAE